MRILVIDVTLPPPPPLPSQWIQTTNLTCRQTVSVCGFTAGRQDNWLITQHISRMVNGTVLEQVTVQVDFTLNSCMRNDCTRRFAIQRYETSIINVANARNLRNYQLVNRIDPRDDLTPTVRENASLEIGFRRQDTGFYLGIQDITSCLTIHRVLVFYYVCPAMTSDLIIHSETIAPVVGDSTPVEVVGQCVENASPENGIEPRLTCSPMGIWSVISGAGCVCNSGFQSTSDDRSCEGMLSVLMYRSAP